MKSKNFIISLIIGIKSKKCEDLMNKNLISAELARRELARRYYAEYLPYAHGDSWEGRTQE